MVEATEEEKTLPGVTKVLDFLQQSNCTRQSVLITIGGGIIQDIGAFASHVYYRGIKWIFIPTTLLAMSDSCIGAKCGINFHRFKNQLGVFHSPTQVFVCLKFLDTLSDNDVLSGYGEILKLLLTGSAELFERLKNSVVSEGLRNKNLSELVYQSLKVKKGVIEVDEYETDLRRILNYGHTFGHALEAIAEYEIPHGLAVAWGVDLANWIAYRRGMLSERDFKEIHEFIAKQFHFRLSRNISTNELIQGVQRDKKISDGKISLILMEHFGSLKILPTPFDSSLEASVDEYLEHYNVISSD